MQRPRHDILQLALKSYGKGNFADAERLFAKVLRQEPSDFNALHMLGVIRAQQAKFAEADRLIAKALEFGASPEAFSNHGNVLSELGRHEEAIKQLRRALLMKPDYAEAQFNLGNALVKCERPEEAAKAFADAVKIKPDFAEALENIAKPLRELGRHQEAIAALHRAIALRPRDADLRNTLGVALQEAGEMDNARTAFDEALALSPLTTESYYHRVRVMKVTAQDDIVSRMESVARQTAALTPAAHSMLCFALGKAYEDLGRYDEAFANLLEANRLARTTVKYNEADATRRVERLCHAFTPELMSAKAEQGSPSDVPIFIVGFPRSGTTLTEQILASHSQVWGSGEHGYLGEVASLPLLEAGGQRFPESLPALPAENFRKLGESYIERLRKAAPTARRVTDKLPGNFMFLGLVNLILPRARIIHVKRDAIDTCVSCFAQRFGGDNVAYTYELGELGRHYRLYLELMAHWRRILPAGALLEIQYEDLIENLEPQARRIVDHCALAWEDRCLAFHETDRSVRTASLAQVRQPIYHSSVQRWRRFERHLGPLLSALGTTPSATAQ